jgi:hypothetical protein
LNLAAEQLKDYTEPSGESEPVGFRRCAVLKPGDSLDLTLDGKVLGRLAFADLLP